MLNLLIMQVKLFQTDIFVLKCLEHLLLLKQISVVFGIQWKNINIGDLDNERLR